MDPHFDEVYAGHSSKYDVLQSQFQACRREHQPTNHFTLLVINVKLSRGRLLLCTGRGTLDILPTKISLNLLGIGAARFSVRVRLDFHSVVVIPTYIVF